LNGSGPDCSTQSVGPAVAEHGSASQIGWQAAHGSTDSWRGTDAGQTRTEQNDHLGRSTWPQIEQIGEVGSRCDQGGIEHSTQHSAHRLRAARPRAPYQQGGRGGADADADDLDHPAGQLARPQRLEVTSESFGLARSVKVVIRSDQRSSGASDGHGQMPAARWVEQPVYPHTGQQCDDRDRTLRECHVLASEVGSRPARPLLSTSRTLIGSRCDDGGSHPRGRAGQESAPHLSHRQVGQRCIRLGQGTVVLSWPPEQALLARQHDGRNAATEVGNIHTAEAIH